MSEIESDGSKVSVIIPVFNDRQRLEQCLEALEDQTYPKDWYEVIVVDNASTVELKDLVSRFQQTRYCYEGMPGSYAARNKGLSIAVGEVIAFTDSDCIPAPDWVARGVVALKNVPNCGLVGGAIDVFFRDPNRPTGVELYESLTAFPQREYIEKANFGATANVFTYRRIFDSVGYFDPDLKSGGDAEWGKRVARAGYTLHYAQDVHVYHPARSTYTEYYKKTVRVMGGLPAFRDQNVPKRAILREFIKGAVPPRSRIRQILAKAGDKQFDVHNKVKLVLFVLFLHYVWVFHRARLLLKN